MKEVTGRDWRMKPVRGSNADMTRMNVQKSATDAQAIERSYVLLVGRYPFWLFLVDIDCRVVIVVVVVLDDVPDLFSSVTEPAAGDTSTQTEVADTDGIVLELVCEGVVALGHGTDEDANALLGCEVGNVVAHADDGGVETEGDLAAVGREVVGDGVLDDLQQLLLRRSGADGQSVKELDHQTGEALKCTGNADGRADFDQDTLCCVDVDLEFAGLVERRVEEGEETLRMG
jgi:hypothetical protein